MYKDLLYNKVERKKKHFYHSVSSMKKTQGKKKVTT